MKNYQQVVNYLLHDLSLYGKLYIIDIEGSVEEEMKCIKRYERYKEEDFDKIILDIAKGVIKSGMYSDLVKIDKAKKLKGGTYFETNSGE